MNIKQSLFLLLQSMIFRDSPGHFSLKRRNLINRREWEIPPSRNYGMMQYDFSKRRGNKERGYAIKNAMKNLFWIVEFPSDLEGE